MATETNVALAQLFERGAYEVEDSVKLPLLKDALLEELEHHLSHSAPFRRYWDRRGYNLDRATDLTDLPFLPTNVFKDLGNELRSVAEEDVRVSLQSSATSGRPSTILVDRITSRRQTKALSLVLADILGKKRRPFLFLDVNPKRHSGYLGARAAAILGFLNHASNAEYFLKPSDGGLLELDRQAFEEANKRYSNSSKNGVFAPVLFGFTYVLFQHVIEPLFWDNVRFTLPQGSALVHIGGWKKLQDMRVDKSRFNDMARRVFAIEPDHIFDIYGFTEQMGMNYPDCARGVKHVPSFGEVIVRDAITWEPVPDGNEGVLQFLSPLPHSYPGTSVLTDDLGKVASRQKCECGRHGTGFVVTGRLAEAEIRGCGDVMAEAVMAPARATISTRVPARPDRIDVLLHNGQRQSSVDDLTTIMSDLRSNGQWLATVPVEALVAMIGKLATRWIENEALALYRKQGLAYLHQWCSPDNLRALTNLSTFDSRGHLDGFLPSDQSMRKKMMAIPRGFVVHWLAGNVPLIGMFALVQSILAKNVNLVKVPAEEPDMLPTLLSELNNVNVVFPSGYKLRGEDLLKTITVVYFDKEHTAGAQLSAAADVRVAWGGRDAIESISSHPKKYHTEDIFFGPKFSFMVMGREHLSDDSGLKRLVRRAATDSSVFDQYACSSPHTIFVEVGGEISPEQFAERLSVEMEKAFKRIPKADVDAGTALEINLRRIKYDMFHDVWSSKGLTWTVLYDEKDELAIPCYSRVVTVRPVQDAFQTLKHITKEIQTVGLALTGQRRLQYARDAALRGAERFPDIGRMSFFDSPWDGMFPMHKLVRWVSLGGP